MFSNAISLDFCKKPNIHFDLILFFHFPVKLVLPTYGSFSLGASQITIFPVVLTLPADVADSQRKARPASFGTTLCTIQFVVSIVYGLWTGVFKFCGKKVKIINYYQL